MADINLPGSMPIVWLKAPNQVSLDRSLAGLQASITNLHLAPSTNHQGQPEGWIREPSGNFRYIIHCPGDPANHEEPIKETRDERYQRILQRRQEAEERGNRKKRGRSLSPIPEAGRNPAVPASSSSALSSLASDGMTLGTDGYPREREHSWDDETLDAAGYPTQRGENRSSSSSVTSTASSEERGRKRRLVGNWLNGTKSESAESEIVKNETAEKQVGEDGDGEEVVSQTTVTTRVIRPLRRSPRH
ncbi:MAG: hypothetical protein Q9216_001927 [Gyalolechia sp. 2 TL-2023]